MRFLTFYALLEFLIIVVDSQISSDTYLGCFADSRISRDLTFIAASDNMTPRLCSVICASLSFRYLGLQYASECYCGYTYGKYGKLDDKLCNYYCRGNTNITCGGLNANSIWDINSNSIQNPSQFNGKTEWNLVLDSKLFDPSQDSLKLFEIIGQNLYIIANYTLSSTKIDVRMLLNNTFYRNELQLNLTENLTYNNMLISWKSPNLFVYINCQLMGNMMLTSLEQLNVLGMLYETGTRMLTLGNMLPSISDALMRTNCIYNVTTTLDNRTTTAIATFQPTNPGFLNMFLNFNNIKSEISRLLRDIFNSFNGSSRN